MVRIEKMSTPEGEYVDELVVRQVWFRLPNPGGEAWELVAAERMMHQAAHQHIAQAVGVTEIVRKGVPIVSLWDYLLRCHLEDGSLFGRYIVVSRAAAQWRKMVDACREDGVVEAGGA